MKSQNNLKLKVRTEFPNVWGEYKYHTNPYIQGTTVPCDSSTCNTFVRACTLHNIYQTVLSTVSVIALIVFSLLLLGTTIALCSKYVLFPISKFSESESQQ